MIGSDCNHATLSTLPTCSVSGKIWQWRTGDPRIGLMISQRFGLHELIGRVLAGREIELEQVARFLTPSLRDDMPNPSHLLDMDVATARLVTAITNGERIMIFGDYDVDGATSTALLMRFVRAVGGQVDFYIPDRILEGYGPNATALEQIQAAGSKLVVTVDCGITAHESLTTAQAIGLDVVVVDHHLGDARLPPAIAVINANRPDETSHLGNLAAVGVTFLLVVAVNRALRQAGWYEKVKCREPDLMRWLDLVALGTVCDMVPLTGLNRTYVAQGLKILAKRQNAGLTELADLVQLEAKPTSWHLGFMLGPRINAGGRVGAADLGTRLLIEEDPRQARIIAVKLDEYNKQRREIEAEIVRAAIEQCEALPAERPLVLAANAGWHPGVIGIVASQICARFNKPTLVLAIDPETGTAKGSGRSIIGVDLGAAVMEARKAGLLLNGGGHAMAVGICVTVERISEMWNFLSDRIIAQAASDAYTPKLSLDGFLRPSGSTLELIDLLEQIGPFGIGNPEPRFAWPQVRISWSSWVGQGHFRCNLTDANPGIRATGQGFVRLPAIAFRVADTALGQHLATSSGPNGPAVTIVGHLRRNHWRGKDSVQLVIEDSAVSEPERLN